MPRATLPTTALGWAVALLGSLIGFIGGIGFLRLVEMLGL